MSQTLHLEVPDPLFAALVRQAANEGTSAEAVAAAALAALFQQPQPSHDEAADAAAFRALFGAADLGRATGLTNEAIDADLIPDYARGL